MRTQEPMLIRLSIAVALAATAACSENAPSAGAEPAKESAAPATPSAAEASSVDLKGVVTAYDVIRDQLAKDQVNAVKASAAALHSAADAASKTAAEGLRGHLTQLAATARALSDADPTNDDALRRSFGDTSQHVVALLTAEPSLREGMHVFECPMAQGYPKWVQADPKLQNPYMGARMLECGGESEWK